MIALKAEVKNKALDFRSLERLLGTPEFEEAWKLDPLNTFVHFAITSGNVDEVKAWIKRILVPEVGEMSMRQLRLRASDLGVTRVSLHTKDELIVKIVQLENARKAKITAS